jgi:hypothetical protein
LSSVGWGEELIPKKCGILLTPEKFMSFKEILEKKLLVKPIINDYLRITYRGKRGPAC